MIRLVGCQDRSHLIRHTSSSRLVLLIRLSLKGNCFDIEIRITGMIRGIRCNNGSQVIRGLSLLGCVRLVGFSLSADGSGVKFWISSVVGGIACENRIQVILCRLSLCGVPLGRLGGLGCLCNGICIEVWVTSMVGLLDYQLSVEPFCPKRLNHTSIIK